jgi:hypothetical protein
MPHRYVLLREDGGTPRLEFLGVFSRSSAAKDAAGQLANDLDWNDIGQAGGPLQIAEAQDNVWERYAIVRLEDEKFADPPVAL